MLKKQYFYWLDFLILICKYIFNFKSEVKMCGIVGYLGNKPAEYVIIQALKRLEYRGYDSSGVALLDNGEIIVEKEKGKIVNLENKLFEKGKKFFATLGIGHTRWATHGEPSKINAHPHSDCNNKIAVVHNGIIENYVELREFLEKRSHKFCSNTDTEVIPHLIEEKLKYTTDIKVAIFETVKDLKGAFALGIVLKDYKNLLIGVRKGSPLIFGVGEDEYFLASDIPAFLEYTNKAVVLEDNDIIFIKKDGYEIYNNFEKTDRRILEIEWSPAQAEKSGYKHFMIKEIMEQPEAITDTFIDKINFTKNEIIFHELDSSLIELLKKTNDIAIAACGTSWHASLIGKYLMEEIADVIPEVDYASELRYRERPIDENTILIAVSQSGETADTLETIRKFKNRDAKIISICNVLGSSISRESDYTIYTHAGPEISVASTKAFTCQITIFYLLALFMGKLRGKIQNNELESYLLSLKELPEKIKRVLALSTPLKNISADFSKYNNFLYLGRGINFPVALEGALKLKEISYIHAEGYPGGEMKHGPLALIDENMPVVVLLPKDNLYEKMLGNLHETKSRKGVTIVFTNESNNDNLENLGDFIFKVPDIDRFLQPIVYAVPLQLLSYHIADYKGCDIDQPRNLAKSVTVE